VARRRIEPSFRNHTRRQVPRRTRPVDVTAARISDRPEQLSIPGIEGNDGPGVIAINELGGAQGQQVRPHARGRDQVEFGRVANVALPALRAAVRVKAGDSRLRSAAFDAAHGGKYASRVGNRRALKKGRFVIGTSGADVPYKARLIGL